jgi:hypothetical protein
VTTDEFHIRELEALPERLRQLAWGRHHCVHIWDWAVLLGKTRGVSARESTDRILDFLKVFGIEVSRATLYNWRRAVRNDDLWGLVDQRGLRGRARRFGRFFFEFERLYCGPGLRPVEVCHELAVQIARANSWPCPVLRDSIRYLKKYILPGIKAGRGGRVDGRFDGRSTDI